MNVLFTNLMPKRISTKCTAIQPAEYLNKLGHKATYSTNPIPILNNFEVIVFSKWCDVQTLLASKKANLKTIWFADENLFSKEQVEEVLKHKDSLDGIISNHEVFTQKCRDLGFDKQLIGIVPHHHCNFNNENVPFRESVSKVGYLGVDFQLHNTQEIKDFLKSYNVELTLKGQESCKYEDYCDIDVGIVYIDPQSEEPYSKVHRQIDYRSGVKLANFIAWGIPSVVSPYNSYKYVSKLIPESNLFAENFEDFKEKLAKLIHDKELRKTLRENGLKNREKLHITEVLKNYYIPFFKKIIKQ